ncbi:MAG: hypothetical protein K2M65_02955, partial [Muribaculaceae bacterium]|nr:hypothetical protein [Muribaculaceae bacterium]
MKRNILAILVFLTMHSTYSHAEDVSNFNDSIETSISEDSLISLLFPRAKLQHVDPMIQEQVTTGSYVSSDNQRQIQRISAPETVYSIDKTKGVGEIPITSSVSPTGAKMYEVPIELPAGMNNYTPNLKLVYNSQNGYSVLGEGWDIDGISIISRCQRSIYYDGYTEGIKFDNNESFTLSGQKLIKTSGDNKNIWFETETGHIKVKSYLNNGHTKYFEVFYPDGTKGIFGDSTSITTPLYYPLMSMTDLFNNNISYSYTTNADSNIN